ncbi:ribitol-5-phosphate transferase FKTN-like [Boleophthalmus pectinirostris]|uniref:ribitol-5-phosphate transferase FKTN-like n=1 Tax=Boleophthalmus pectinirostris TaxID=150288 RepID=UPI00242A7090|nr:ribitol-5-phosphate transferase FKTN-like [Boleophthalmus pectinirostris]
MVRVNRSALLYVLALGSCAFLLFQLYYYRKYVTKAGPRLLSADSQWVVRSFLSGSQSCRLPVFLIDVAALNSVSHDAPGPHHCNFLCSRPITAFGLNAKHWSHDASSCFLSALEQKDFTWILTSAPPPTLPQYEPVRGSAHTLPQYESVRGSAPSSP